MPSLVIPPLGVSPLGLFTPAELASFGGPPALLADLVDYGETDEKLPPRQATFEVMSLTRGLHPIDEQVLIAWTRVRNSGAAVQNDGNRFVDVRKLDQSAPSLLEAEARTAVARLVANRDIELLKVKITIAGDQANFEGQYRNLRATDRNRVRSTTFFIPTQVRA